MRRTLSLILAMFILGAGLQSCGWLRASGQAVESVGEGAGHAVTKTGRAIGNAADETEDRLN